MNSGILGNSNGDLNTSGRFPTDNMKVYTRRFRKKAPEINNNNGTAANATSITQNQSDLSSSAATTSENPSTTPNPAETTTSETPNDSAAVSHNHDIPATTTSVGNQGNDAVREYLGIAVTKDADYSQENVGEQSPHDKHIPSYSSAAKDLDFSLHDQEDDSLTPSGVQHDSGCENAEQQNSLPESDEVENLKTPSPLHNGKRLPNASFGEESSVFGEHDEPNGKEVAETQFSSCDEGEFTQILPQVTSANGTGNNVNRVVKPLVITRVNDKVIFNLFKETPKNEIEDFRKKLECELHKVRMQVERLGAKEIQLASYNTPVSNSNHMIYVSAEGQNVGGYSNVQSQRPVVEDVIANRALMRVNSEVGVMEHQDYRPMVLSRMNSDMGAARNLEPRPYNRQLSVAVMENNHRDNEFVEKEKRTPKANQFYRNSEFLLGKDRLPPESNKRSKLNNGRKHSAQTDQTFGFGFGFSKLGDRVFKSFNGLLQRLMKHKFGWVFNEPVDAKALGLVDYHDIIKYPMDLGTIKTRLSDNRYKSPMEFADDVRLVFRNAMTYNPKGQDVHVMAEELSQMFEERWAVIEMECNPYLNYQMYQKFPTPISKKVPPQSHFGLTHVPRNAVLPVNLLARTETMTIGPKIQRPQIVRTHVPKKPKANDPNKRDMTYDEKQRLSTNLQGLPSEKLDDIVQIIKRRNTAVSQHDDEIEVDIDNVDAETLWELDRFVINYKKRLSKNKRKAEYALQARKATSQVVVPKNITLSVAEMQLGSAASEKGNAPADDGEKQRYNNGSRSSSSSSSSSDSGSSSDSDSDTSSADGSAHSPKT